MGVERLAGDAGLTRQSIDSGETVQHLVETAHIQRDAAAQRRKLALERGAGAERHHRHLVRVAQWPG
jgi:hypothetical protein